MSDERGFTVHDHRRVKLDGEKAETGGESRAGGRPGADPGKRTPMPPVDFSGFVLGLAQMALVHLGEMPLPGSDQAARDLEQARHTIDLLDMLEEKTRGNLNEQETALLKQLRGELKLKYVQAS